MGTVGPLLLLFSLAGGYVFLQACFFTKHRWDALEWERNLFEAALVGGVLFVVVRTFAPTFEQVPFFVRLRDLIRAAIPYQFSASFAAALVLSGVIAVIANLLIPREQAIRLAVRRHGGELLILLQDAAQRGDPVALTMVNRKVYIGFVVAPPSPKYPYTKIIPTVSGHRKTESLRMVLDTIYWQVFEDLERRRGRGETPGVDPESFGIVLPIADICSANLFDNDTYGRYFETKLAGAKAGDEQPDAPKPGSPE